MNSTGISALYSKTGAGAAWAETVQEMRPAWLWYNPLETTASPSTHCPRRPYKSCKTSAGAARTTTGRGAVYTAGAGKWRD